MKPKRGDRKVKGKRNSSDKLSWPIETVFLTIDFAFVDRILGNGKGRKGYSPSVLFKCLLLVYLGYYPSIRQMVDGLRHNQHLAKVMGLPLKDSVYKVPNRTTFSKFLDRCRKDRFALVFIVFVMAAIHAGIINGTRIAMDATLIWAWSNPYKKKPSDKDARWGVKRKTKKKTIRVFGYKVHVVVDAKTELPIAFYVTPANRNETRIFWKLLAMFLIFGLRARKVLADAAYDVKDIREAIIRILRATPFIPINTRRTKGKGEKEKKRKRAKALRAWYKSEGLLSYYVRPSSVKFKGIFKERTTVERNHSNGKGQYHLDTLRFRGLEKATIHVTLCLTAQLVVALTAVRVGHPELIRCSTKFTA